MVSKPKPKPNPDDPESGEQEQYGGSCGCLLSKDYLCGTNCSNKYYRKYLKYKNKYMNLKGGGPPPLPTVKLTNGKNIKCPNDKCPNPKNPCCSANTYEEGNNPVLCMICGHLHPKEKDKYKAPCNIVDKVFKEFDAPSQKDKNTEKYMQIKKATKSNCK